MILLRLVVVELRKSIDTRSARWLLAVIVLLAAGCSTVASTSDPTLTEFVGSALIPLPALLPVVAVLAATTDWSQRASLTTFALTPRRTIVLAARAVAAVLLVFATSGAIIVMTSITFALIHPGQFSETDWQAFGTSLWSVTALALAAALSGVALGYLLLNTPLAIAVTILVPVSYEILAAAKFPVVGKWVSSLAFSQWLAQPQWHWLAPNETSIGLGPALCSLALWTVAPMAAGFARQLRKEVK